VYVPIVQHDPRSRIERGREFGTIPGEFTRGSHGAEGADAASYRDVKPAA